ncbi:MAG: hypothetical protein MJD61_09200, partial [Proteobacteria bacterium]|nr:hypothetical protein [Pseudomonadota bacterium]
CSTGASGPKSALRRRVKKHRHFGADFQASCWGLHGEALSGPRAIFGCHQALDGGALLLSWNDRETKFESRKLQYPGYPDAPNRTSVLAGHPDSPYVVGQWGTFAFPNNFYDGLVRISPTATEITDADTLELGSVYCSFGFERSRGELVAALTRNGELHVVDVERWLVGGSVRVLPDLEAEGRCAGAMVLGKGVAYISDTRGGSIMEVDLAARTVTRSFSVSGSPGGMALLGMFGIPGEPAH